MKNIKPIVPVILILVGLGVGFFGGYEYRNYRLTQTRGGFAVGGGNFQRFIGNRAGTGQNGAMRAAALGSILSIDTNSITVKMADGSTRIVILSGSTTYSNTVSASQSDLKTGDNVAITGTPNSDGSVTATSVQLNPEFGRQAVSSPNPSAK